MIKVCYRYFIFLFLPLGCLVHASHEDSTPFSSKETPPMWVKEQLVPIDPPLLPSHRNHQRLLRDIQHNWEEKTIFCHHATKALNKTGLEKIGRIHIDFNPSYEKIVFHSLRILRNGQAQDRLETSRYNILQQEDELKDNVFNGRLTLVYFLDDVRIGDSLEYSFSIVGSHPLFSSHYDGFFYLQNDEPIEKRYQSLLIHPDKALNIKQFHTALEPKITDISPSLREYSIAIQSSEYTMEEPNEPSWYNPYPRIQISEYHSWEDVVKAVLPLYTFSEEIESYTSPQMIALINQWRESTEDPIGLATLALRFVQDEVRYLGFVEGLNSHKPTNPSVVFERRYGDCKDKTMLLYALLDLMEIRSTPVLVHASGGVRLPEILPFPYAFNHLVLQIQIGAVDYWVDPTISLQGGSLEQSYFPEYHWGLLVTRDATVLIPLPKSKIDHPVEIASLFTFPSLNSADLVITTTFYGHDADHMRRRIQNRGMNKISEDFANFIHRKYRGSIDKDPMTCEDDRENNVLTTQEFYSIPTRSHGEMNFLRLHSYVIATFLNKDVRPQRNAPYKIEYPLWVKEIIRIENPSPQALIEPTEVIFNHESFNYTFSVKNQRNTLHIEYELKNLKDHVPPQSIKDYWMFLNDVEASEVWDVSIGSLE